MKTYITCALAVSTALALAIPARAADAGVASAAEAPASAAQMPLTEGEVRKIDPDNRRITLRHGEILNLEMPGMTMVFQVQDSALLNGLKVGDKVRFRAERLNGALVVTRIEIAP